MNNELFNRHYLALLIEHYKLVDEEIDTMEAYMTEENFSEHFPAYRNLNVELSVTKREIGRVAREIGLTKKKIRSLTTE